MELQVQIQMLRNTIGLAFTLLALAGLSGAQAAAIHKWVDEKGVTHYSDEPPQDVQNTVTRLPIETGISTPRSTDDEATEHYYSIANQWQRMQQEGLQRQQRELQRAALKRASQAAAPRDEYRERRSSYYVSAYPRRHHRRHGSKVRYPPIEHYGGQQSSPGGQISSGFPTN